MTYDPERTASALTLARGRDAHLRNVIIGLTRQSVTPAELIIGYMQDAPYTDLPDTPFPIRQVHVAGDELPLARARNVVANAAKGDVLVFLDVDCIPSPALVKDYIANARPGDGLIMGEVNYLPAGAVDDAWTYSDFEDVAVRHSDRQGPPDKGRKACGDYRNFWSLNFAISREDWARSGGFDPRFVGYGGEDTDFGRTLDSKGIPIWWIAGAKVFHQHHMHFMPPIHHVASIIRNSELFASKWGHRTMEHWLHAFRMMGLIDADSAELRILRKPDADDLDLCRQRDDMPYAATGRVIRILEDREREKRGQGPETLSMAERHKRMTERQNELATPLANSVAAE